MEKNIKISPFDSLRLDFLAVLKRDDQSANRLEETKNANFLNTCKSVITKTNPSRWQAKFLLRQSIQLAHFLLGQIAAQHKFRHE